MAGATAAAFASALADAVAYYDGDTLAALMRMDKASIPGGAQLLAALGPSPDAAACAPYVKALTPQWQAVIVPHLQAACAYAAGRHLDALSRWLDSMNGLGDIAKDSGAWIVRPLLVVNSECSLAFDRAGKEAAATGRREVHMELTNRALATLRTAWSACYNHRVPKEEQERSRKMGAMAIACLLFRLYFRIDQPRQCSFYVGNMDRQGMLPPLDRYPLAQTVTYRYYSGRLSLYEEKFGQAADQLGYALRNCHRAYPGNARRILEALLPVKLRLGQAPPPGLLETYGLEAAWGGIVAGVTTGNMSAFRTSLSTHASYFIRIGVYLLLEGLAPLVLRTLIKRVARITGSTQIRLPHLAAVLSAPAVTGPHGEGMDQDELECLCAVLVSRKLVRGYVSHSPPVLVLAKEKAFPKIGDVA